MANPPLDPRLPPPPPVGLPKPPSDAFDPLDVLGPPRQFTPSSAPPVEPAGRQPASPSAAPGMLVCGACGSLTRGRTVVKGSFLVEIFLWLCGGLPGLIYTAWRWTTRGRGCDVCESKELIPLGSPRGRDLYERLKR